MGKNNRKRPSTPSEDHLILPPTADTTLASIVDTHTHLISTFSAYQSKYKPGKYKDLFEFMRAMYTGHRVEALVDVWCDAPVQKSLWRELADSALNAEERESKWGNIDYWFVIGVHPHYAKSYTDQVEQDILDAMSHPRCVGWGEIGLDYHYDNSPRDVQRDVFVRQLRHAVRLRKPITIHTREAEQDTERILKEEVPKETKIHIHCCTDSPGFAQRLMEHFPNLYIGITGVITYSTNQNTSNIIRDMSQPPSTATGTATEPSLRILLETDAPYMVPGNIYTAVPSLKGQGRLPICHTGMVPWTADFVAQVAGEGWNRERVMQVARENAKSVYGV